MFTTTRVIAINTGRMAKSLIVFLKGVMSWPKISSLVFINILKPNMNK